MKATHVLPVLIATAAASLVFAGDAGAARSKPVACGDTITASVKLDHDLTDCPNNGIVIGADGITLDLNGHTIDGDHALQDCEPGADCDLGVLKIGHRAVTIKGGAIRQFAVGVVADGADENRLRSLSVSDNEFAGIVVANASGSEITHSSVFDNGLETEGSGIVMFGSHDVRLTRNRTSGNGDAGVLVGGSHDVLIAENIVTDAPFGGIVIDHSDANEITRNRAIRVGNPVIVVGDNNTVSRNYVADTVHCADGGCGQGISFEGGTGNVIERNVVVRTLEAGIRVAAFEPETPPATGNTVRRNVIRDSATDGVLVEETAKDTLVERNLAIGSSDDGIDVDNAAATLRRNVADRNGDLGIEAVTGVTDGGHNRAHGNGNPAQCLNVVCR